MLFTDDAIKGQKIVYAVDNEGNEINVQDYNNYEMDNFEVVSGILHAKGNKVCTNNCDSTHDIMILFFKY